MNAIDQILQKEKPISIQTFDHINRGEESKIQEHIKSFNGISMLIPIGLFEILVCILGYQFYKSIGYDSFSAATLAVAIESFYMYFSSRKSLKSIILKSILLLISVVTLSYSSYSKDQNVINKITFLKSEISEGKDRLGAITDELKNLDIEKINIEKDMALFRKFDKATKGNQVLAPRRKELNEQKRSLIKERYQIQSNLKESGQKLVGQNFFTNFNILSIQTLVSIFAFTIVQLAICIALPEILDQLKNKNLSKE